MKDNNIQNTPPPSPGPAHPSRRAFLSSSVACGVTAALGGWSKGSSLKPRRGKIRSKIFNSQWHLEAVRVEQTFFNGVTLPFFRFRGISGTKTLGNIPLLPGNQGTLASLHITNSLPFAIQPEVVGLDTGPIIQPGETAVMGFKLPPVGTWLLTDALLGPAAGPVGLGAVIISRPWWINPEPLSVSSTPPKREFVLLYQNTDDRWNIDLDAGLAPDITLYEPNYHLINGLSAPEVMTDPSTRIVCRVGENVLLHFANLGHVRQSIHFHGYHVQLLSQNNVPVTMYGMKDTIPLPGYSTAEVLLPVNQPGVYPFHPHSLTTVTVNGYYPSGQLGLIDAQ